MTNQAGEPIPVDLDLGHMTLQPAFVEGILADRKRFPTLEAAYRHIFRGNLECGILLWSGVPVRIGYREDLPAMVGVLIVLLDWVRAAPEVGSAEFHFDAPRVETRWRVEVRDETVAIQSEWRRVPGDYAEALARLGTIWMPRDDFLSEWKLLLEQLVRAFADAEAEVTGAEAGRRMRTLQRLEAAIPTRGRYYHYPEVPPP